ncbi:hypothetical protein CPT_Moby_190 [Stenotrophomonas phage Moby]|uniref:Uncharacterized protein n=1 Tax=Stenotrophomonas phage Moby TaxID=2601680 RepID=A0A5P8PMN9_9CAUD|nr:hypothetical protein HWC58_gp208 [Stenotrophomonas phage Moby]QFR57915.1 hypothetical protein CPT_Moby_190 [Stenotrophomonas phage Moby]
MSTYIERLLDGLEQNLDHLLKAPADPTYLGFSTKAVLAIAIGMSKYNGKISRVDSKRLLNEINFIRDLAAEEPWAKFSDDVNKHYIVGLNDQVYVLNSAASYAISSGVRFEFSSENVWSQFSLNNNSVDSVIITARDLVDYHRLSNAIAGAMSSTNTLKTYAEYLRIEDLTDLTPSLAWIATDASGEVFIYASVPRLILKQSPDCWLIRDSSRRIDEDFVKLHNGAHKLSGNWLSSVVHISDLVAYMKDHPKKPNDPVKSIADLVDGNLGVVREDALAAEADLQKAFARITQVYSETGNIRAALLKSLEDFLI